MTHKQIFSKYKDLLKDLKIELKDLLKDLKIELKDLLKDLKIELKKEFSKNLDTLNNEDLEKFENNFQLPKMLMAVSLENMAYGYRPLTEDTRKYMRKKFQTTL